MKAVKLQLATRTLLNPAAQQWAKVPAEEMTMGGTPLHQQPSKYVRAAWAGKPLGAVRFLKVQAAHNRKDIAFRPERAGPPQDRDHARGSGGARGRWVDGRGGVGFARPLGAGGDRLPRARGTLGQVAFAVWEGSS